MKKPDKSLGQHWLNDENSLISIVNSASVTQNDTVLEIGPGQGALTKYLVSSSKEVIGVEFDPVLASELMGRVPAENLKVINQDILQFNLGELPKDYKIVANIPYYLTSKLVRVISESENPPLTAVLLVQKEVAERIAAKPGDMSILSVTAQFFWDVSLGILVKAELFTPAPKVDSQVVVLKRREEQLFGVADNKEFFRVVKAGFASRRKTLQNSLSGGLRINKKDAEQLLDKAGVDGKLRPQTLSLSNWRRIYQVAQSLGYLS